MAARNEMDATGFSFEIGQAAEINFERLARSRGWEVQASSKHQDIYGHFDFIIRKDGVAKKVEVKAAKRFPILGKDRKPTHDFILVEWKGITGHDGWIYGEADTIAIERDKGFYMIPRRVLLEVADKLTSQNWVDNKREMLYNMYGRKERQDCVSAIMTTDILITRQFEFWLKGA